MSVLLFILACAVFAQATSEFMLAGLVAEIAAEFGVSVAMAGWCTSAFAVGMVVGAPLMALSARRFPPRAALASFLVLFVAMHVLAALTPLFSVLLVSRLFAALANAGFLAVAFGVAIRSVPAHRTARATGALLSGTTLALIVGVPAGALLGQLFGWRSTFWVVAALAATALIGTLAVPVPSPPVGPRPSVAGELTVLTRRPVALTLLVGALVNAGTFSVYTYLGPLLTGTSRAPATLVPVALAVFGVGAFLGVSAAARLADAYYRTLVTAGGAALLVGWVALALLAGVTPVAMVLVALLGLLAFVVGSSVIARSMSLAPDAPTMGGAFTTSALNIGATLGPVLGGMSLAIGPVGPAWVAALLVLIAAVPVAVTLLPMSRGGAAEKAAAGS